MVVCCAVPVFVKNVGILVIGSCFVVVLLVLTFQV